MLFKSTYIHNFICNIHSLLHSPSSLQYRAAAKQMTNTNNFVVHKILQIDNTTFSCPSSNTLQVMQTCRQFNLWFSCIWICKNKQTTHHHEVSLKTFSTAVIKQEAVFLKKQQISEDIFLSMNRVYFCSWAIGKMQTFLENILCPSVSQGKAASSV